MNDVLVVGIRGTIEPSEWYLAELRSEPDADAYSMIGQHSEMLELNTFASSLGGVTGREHWTHSDAGEDWTAGTERLLTWLQVSIDLRDTSIGNRPPPLRRSLPLYAVLRAVEEATRRVGETAITEYLALMPVEPLRGVEHRVRLGAAARWLSYGSADQAPISVAVGISGVPGASLERERLRAAILSRVAAHTELVGELVTVLQPGTGPAGASASRWLARARSERATFLVHPDDAQVRLGLRSMGHGPHRRGRRGRGCPE